MMKKIYIALLLILSTLCIACVRDIEKTDPQSMDNALVGKADVVGTLPNNKTENSYEERQFPICSTDESGSYDHINLVEKSSPGEDDWAELLPMSKGVYENRGEFIKAEGADYWIEQWEYSLQDTTRETSINIDYPQIANMDNGVLQKKINRLLHDTAFVEAFGNDRDISGFENSVTYEVVWSGEKLLSVKFNIYFFTQGAAYDNQELITANIDMRTGDELKLEDFFAIDNGLIEKLRNCAIIDSEKYHVFPEAYEYILEDNDEKLIEILKNADIPIYRLDGNSGLIDCASYLTDKTVGISFTTLHALGSYVEIVISTLRTHIHNKKHEIIIRKVLSSCDSAMRRRAAERFFRFTRRSDSLRPYSA